MLQKINIAKKNFSKIRAFSLLLITILLCLCLSFWRTEPLFAQIHSSSANSWQYASFPVESFQAYTSGFGYRISPVSGQRQFHYGLDIAAPYGSYVRNWWSGKVIELSDNSNCGTMIKIGSGQWEHIYCHLIGSVITGPNASYLVDPQEGTMVTLGQTVRYGARIARIGTSGNSTGPHLHWGLKFQGEYVDPGLIVRAMYQQQLSKS